MNLKPLLKCLGQGIDDIQQSFSTHEIAYGHYTVRELRKAILDGQPAIIPFRASTYLVVGENPESFCQLRLLMPSASLFAIRE
jgi:hypothetical protein